MATLDEDHAASPKVSAAMSRKAKFEKIKMDTSATSIQASWRGKSYRRDLQKVTPEQEQVVESESKYGSEWNEADSRPTMSTRKDDDDDGYLEAKEDIDDEERLAITDAEDFEERQIQEAKSYSTLPTWPDAFTDNFDDPGWPDLGSNDGTYGNETLFRILTKVKLMRSELFK